MEVRKATVLDAPEVVRLGGQMFDSMGWAPDAAWFDTAESQFRQRLGPDVSAFVVDDPDRPGKLCSSACGVVQHRLSSPINRSGHTGYVQWVCTDPAHRRQGLSTRVMEALLDWFVSVGVTVVDLHATDDGEPVYRKLGFTDEGPLALRWRAAS